MSNEELHIDGDFTLNIPHFEADFTENEQPKMQADFNISVIPDISNLATKEELNNAVDELESEIEQSKITLQGSPLIDVSTENQTATITSKTFVFEQGIVSDTWIINHNLNKHPSITLAYTNGEQFEAHKEYTSENQVIISLDSAATGFAYLN